MAQNFKVGDIVVLKSGGPKMTVDGIHGPDHCPMGLGPISCTWFDKNKKHHGRFAAEILDLDGANPKAVFIQPEKQNPAASE